MLKRSAFIALCTTLVSAILIACGSAPTPTATSAAVQPTTAPQAPSAAPAANATRNLNAVYTFRVVPEESSASYEVREHIFRFPAPQTTIGTVKNLQGEFALGYKDGKPYFQMSKLTVDLRGLTSDSSQRDNRIRSEWLESNKFPIAEFTPKSIEDLAKDAVEGKELTFKVVGDLKIRDVTKPLTFNVKATLQGDTLTGVGTTYLLMKDYGFAPPDIASILTVTDGVTLTVKGTAKIANVSP